jgi:hypothetical protein
MIVMALLLLLVVTFLDDNNIKPKEKRMGEKERKERNRRGSLMIK